LKDFFAIYLNFVFEFVLIWLVYNFTLKNHMKSVPNKRTLSAIKDIEAGKTTKVKNAKSLFAQLSK